MADFIRKHECGITIERLSDLQEAVRQADYPLLKKHAEEVAVKLQKGYYLSRALDEALGTTASNR